MKIHQLDITSRQLKGGESDKWQRVAGEKMMRHKEEKLLKMEKGTTRKSFRNGPNSELI